MSRSATFSDLARRFAGGVGLTAFLAVGPAASARVLLTQEEALASAFPSCTVERTTIYLTPAESARAAELAEDEPPSGVVFVYRATCGGVFGGTAYFDHHRVRTLAETVMVVVTPDGKVGRVEVLAFDEPVEYLPRDAWYDQFEGRPLDDELRLKAAIRPVTGATLTARATTAAVRRVLALHRVLGERKPAP
ncbi:MAG: FMN-binding protein [Thermoanaerobaculia bacterium]|nr:FMN-binding protein [Thermoanaerobaculia bacterium]